MALAEAGEGAEDLVAAGAEEAEVSVAAAEEEGVDSADSVEEVDLGGVALADSAAVEEASAARVALAEEGEDSANAAEVANSVDDPLKDLEGAVGLAVAVKVVSAVEMESAEAPQEGLVEAAG